MKMKARVKTDFQSRFCEVFTWRQLWYSNRVCFCIEYHVGEYFLSLAWRFRKYPFTDTQCSRINFFLWQKQIFSFYLTQLLAFRVLVVMLGQFPKNNVIITAAHFSDLSSLESCQEIIPVECHVDNMTIENLTLTKLLTKLSSKLYMLPCTTTRVKCLVCF